MSQLPLAENQANALERRRRELARKGWDPAAVNREVLLPRLAKLDWSAVIPEAATLGHALKALLDLKEGTGVSRSALHLWGQAAFGGEPRIRSSAGEPLCPGHRPVDPRLIERRLDRFFEWSTSPAFEELQPLLQLSLTQLRLFELLPFEEHSEEISFWFGAIPLMRGGFLLPLYSADNLTDFKPALDQGFEFDTNKLVGLNLDAVLRSYELVFDLAL